MLVIDINDIVNSNNLFNTVIYADDTTLTATISAFTDKNNSYEV